MSDENKMINDNDETKALENEFLDKPDSPLVVHKKSDASYEETASSQEMNETHTEEEKPTLMRHRFRKEKKSHNGATALLILLVVLVAVFAALYATGNISFGNKDNTTTTASPTTEEITTSLYDLYQGTIVVKDTYIFVDAEEVDGIQGLQEALKYTDASPTAYRIIDEGANADFLNYEILPLMQNLGFYDESTEITHIESTGLIAYEETTTLPPETTTAAPTEPASDNGE